MVLRKGQFLMSELPLQGSGAEGPAFFVFSVQVFGCRDLGCRFALEIGQTRVQWFRAWAPEEARKKWLTSGSGSTVLSFGIYCMRCGMLLSRFQSFKNRSGFHGCRLSVCQGLGCGVCLSLRQAVAKCFFWQG